MADAVSSQTLIDGVKNVVQKFTNLSDGTGEAAVTKVDVSALSGAPAKVRIMKVHYSVTGMVVTLLWDATADVRILDLSGDGCFDFTCFGGLYNNGGDGVTGDIQLTTTGHTANDNYTIILEMVKD
jgi:hypothetical protein